MTTILPPYLLYVALYLGVALTGGSVVHMPLDPKRYVLIGVIGVIIFIVASAIDARRRKLATAEGAALPGYIIWSVILSLGLGMLSGSIQHFIDFPQYAAALLALGVPVSLASYMGREKLLVRGPRLVTLVIAVGVFTIALFFGLDWIADEIAPHSH